MDNLTLINGQRYLFFLSTNSVFTANYLYKLKNIITVDKLSDKDNVSYNGLFSFEYNKILKVIPISTLIVNNMYTIWYKHSDKTSNISVDVKLLHIHKDRLDVNSLGTKTTSISLYDIIDIQIL